MLRYVSVNGMKTQEGGNPSAHTVLNGAHIHLDKYL